MGRRPKSDTPAMLGLTKGERFYLWRRRKGWTQIEAARHFLGKRVRRVDKVADWERGRDEAGCPEVILEDGPTRGEVCAVYRRRNGLRIKDVARLIGVSSPTVIYMERGERDPRRYEDYWGIETGDGTPRAYPRA